MPLLITLIAAWLSVGLCLFVWIILSDRGDWSGVKHFLVGFALTCLFWPVVLAVIWLLRLQGPSAVIERAVLRGMDAQAETELERALLYGETPGRNVHLDHHGRFLP